jgi:hypothetical protein
MLSFLCLRAAATARFMLKVFPHLLSRESENVKAFSQFTLNLCDANFEYTYLTINTRSISIKK